MSENLIKKREGESPIVSYIKRRIRRNENFLSITEGATGSGKSYLDMAIAYQLDPEFNPEKQIVFNFTEFMKALNDEELKKKKYKVLIFEEFQVAASNRNWQSVMNKAINYVMSTFRHENWAVLINAPYKTFLDSQTMKLVHAVIKTDGIDRKRNISHATFNLLQYNSDLDKTYTHSLFVIYPDGEIIPTFEFSFPKPNEHLCNTYEELKTRFTSRLKLDVLQKALEAEDMKQDETVPEDNEPIHKLKGKKLLVYQYIKDNPDKIQKEYAKELDIGEGNLSTMINKIQEKGINIRKYIGNAHLLGNSNNLIPKSKQKPINLSFKGLPAADVTHKEEEQ